MAEGVTFRWSVNGQRSNATVRDWAKKTLKKGVVCDRRHEARSSTNGGLGGGSVMFGFSKIFVLGFQIRDLHFLNLLDTMLK